MNVCISCQENCASIYIYVYIIQDENVHIPTLGTHYSNNWTF